MGPGTLKSGFGTSSFLLRALWDSSRCLAQKPSRVLWPLLASASCCCLTLHLAHHRAQSLVPNDTGPMGAPFPFNPIPWLLAHLLCPYSVQPLPSLHQARPGAPPLHPFFLISHLLSPTSLQPPGLSVPPQRTDWL